jgi:hypothetical protein
LLYPPGCVCAKTSAAVRVKVIDSLYKPYIALLNQIAQTHSPVSVFFGDINDQSQIAAHKLLSGLRVVLFNDQLTQQPLLPQRQ